MVRKTSGRQMFARRSDPAGAARYRSRCFSSSVASQLSLSLICYLNTGGMHEEFSLPLLQTPPRSILPGTRPSLFPPCFRHAKATTMWSLQLALPTFPLAVPGRTAVLLCGIRKEREREISIRSDVRLSQSRKSHRGPLIPITLC